MMIADTSALIAFFIETDSNHIQAMKLAHLFEKETNTVIIPEDVFSELVNILGKKFSHQQAYTVGQYISNSNVFIIESTIDTVRNLALDRFQLQEASVSFTDCIVMAVADQFETKEIFGFDEAFAKNGYIRLGLDSR